jgi:competence protein ComEA
MWETFIRRMCWIAIGLTAGLLGAGILYLTSSQPAGIPIQLNQKPTSAPIIIHIVGAVKNPGVYSLPQESRTLDAIVAAGGYLPAADQGVLNLAGYLEDGDRISVPETITVTESRISFANPQVELLAQPVEGLININLAAQTELESLPGIGEVRSSQIIAYREEHGFFTSIDQIQKVPGIGPKIFENIQAYITVDQ